MQVNDTVGLQGPGCLCTCIWCLQGVILVYDVTRIITFDNVIKKLDDIIEVCWRYVHAHTYTYTPPPHTLPLFKLCCVSL